MYKLSNKLLGRKYFFTLDIQLEYNNLQIQEGDKWKAAFAVPATDSGPPRLFEPWSCSSVCATLRRCSNE